VANLTFRHLIEGSHVKAGARSQGTVCMDGALSTLTVSLGPSAGRGVTISVNRASPPFTSMMRLHLSPQTRTVLNAVFCRDWNQAGDPQMMITKAGGKVLRLYIRG
jgi:hypothetical protein